MEAVIEKECSALGGLFQTIISDMKVRVWAVAVGGSLSPPGPAKLCTVRCSRSGGGVTSPRPGPGPSPGPLLRGTVPRVRAADAAGGRSLARREPPQTPRPRGLGLRVARRTPPLPPSLPPCSLARSPPQTRELLSRTGGSVFQTCRLFITFFFFFSLFPLSLAPVAGSAAGEPGAVLAAAGWGWPGQGRGCSAVLGGHGGRGKRNLSPGVLRGRGVPGLKSLLLG